MTKYKFRLSLILFLSIFFFNIPSFSQDKKDDITIDLPFALVKDISYTVTVNMNGKVLPHNAPHIFINGIPVHYKTNDGKLTFSHTFTGKSEIIVATHHCIIQKSVDPIPLWLSILPPLLAIMMAFITREVFTSLFLGLLSGTVTIFWYQGFNAFAAFFKGLFSIVDFYILNSLYNHDHLSVIVFSMLIGGMVAVISANGGMKGLVSKLAPYAKDKRSGQFITWLLGILIFFDDYANTLIVGNTMRPITDKLNISRAKLAYLTDSTAAPIAAIAFITTWIGAELSYIEEGIEAIGIKTSSYSVFLSSLPYSFYPILTIVFVIILIWKGKEYGPMLKAERNPEMSKVATGPSSEGTPADVSDEIPQRWYNALLPVLVVVFGTIAGLFYTGWNSSVWNDNTLSFMSKVSFFLGEADTFKALLWSSLGGVLLAVILSVTQKILTLRTSVDHLISGFKSMFNAVLILILAWSLALLTQHMHTADFITGGLKAFEISPYMMPAITFVFSALISFSTGSSWGTMAIIYPLIMPAVWALSMHNNLPHEAALPLLYNVVAAVLAGSVLGDHCSPISDTTILSSLASSCNHIVHVRTQMPYALTVGAVSLFAGSIPSAYNIPLWILYPVAISTIYLVIMKFGKKV
ncbi:MAG: Na+/H+ antiporter NhaC family protein [Chlorobi bacterium]|nr:Na+/H+ antiporter NhaC family protein [Chlorobiota bacterium]